MASGGLFQEAVGLYGAFEPRIQIKLKDQKIVFPSGAEISFSHYENANAAKKYQGIQISNIFYDESTHAEEEDIWWLWSRLRSKAKNVHGLVLSCNPDYSSWLLKYALPYLYPEGHELAGRPDPEKNGQIRYLLRINGEIVWGDSPEELVERYGNPLLPVGHKDQVSPISFQGLFGTIDDNPPLQKAQPLYRKNLESLPRLECERLLHGSWFARPESSGYWKREWCREITEYPSADQIEKIARVWDCASNLSTESDPNPDYTVGVKGCKLKNGQYVILDVVRFRARPGDVINKIIETAKDDGQYVDVVIPQDPGAAGKTAAQMMVREITSRGFYCTTARTSGVGGKVDRFRPFSAACQNGLVDILSNCCDDLENKTFRDNSFYYNELEGFTGGRNEKNDCCDASSDLFTYLASRFTMPSNILSGLKGIDFTNKSPLLNV